MISGEEEESSDDEDSEAPAAQWSAIARPAKVLGVDPATQLQVISETVIARTFLLVSTCKSVVQNDIFVGQSAFVRKCIWFWLQIILNEDV